MHIIFGRDYVHHRCLEHHSPVSARFGYPHRADTYLNQERTGRHADDSGADSATIIAVVVNNR
jgi:hypothetical protein